MLRSMFSGISGLRAHQTMLDVTGNNIANVNTTGFKGSNGSLTCASRAAVADRLADKVRALRVFPDVEGRMNEPLGDREVLCVSQFTLYGDARKGNRPSYVAAAPPETAKPLWERFCDRLGARRGVFGAMMDVALVNDGPVTILLEL